MDNNAHFPVIHDLTGIYVSHADLEKDWEEITRDWETLRKTYGYRCVSCGAKEGAPSPFDPRRTVKLQQGHMDPDKDLKPGNVIPQCGWCNQTARGDFVFDEQGRPRAIASVRPVKRASKKVQAEVKKWLSAESDKRNAPSRSAKKQGIGPVNRPR